MRVRSFALYALWLSSYTPLSVVLFYLAWTRSSISFQSFSQTTEGIVLGGIIVITFLSAGVLKWIISASNKRQGKKKEFKVEDIKPPTMTYLVTYLIPVLDTSSSGYFLLLLFVFLSMLLLWRTPCTIANPLLPLLGRKAVVGRVDGHSMLLLLRPKQDPYTYEGKLVEVHSGVWIAK